MENTVKTLTQAQEIYNELSTATIFKISDASYLVCVDYWLHENKGYTLVCQKNEYE